MEGEAMEPSTLCDQLLPPCDRLAGEVGRRLAAGNGITTLTSTGDAVPEHVQKMMEDNPGQVSIMQWTPTHEFTPCSATDVATNVKRVHARYLNEMHQQLLTDVEMRAYLRQEPATDAFARKYARVFECITRREVATNPRLMTPILHQLYILEEVQGGRMTENQAKGAIASVAMEAIIAEAVSKRTMDPDAVREATAGISQFK